MGLEGKFVLITGGNSGIGEQISYKFAKEKSIVIFTYLKDDKSVTDVKNKCISLGAQNCFSLKLDLRNNESINQFIQELAKISGHIDYLINNAGVINWEKFENETFEEIENQLRTNLEGMIKLTLLSLPFIKIGIINIASRAGHMPFAGRAVYTASKFGVIGFTRSLALERPDLKIFSVSPGAVRTQMWNFKNGIEPEIVANYIMKYLKGKIRLKNGDINIWEKVS